MEGRTTKSMLGFLSHNTIALIALFVALGGTAYAATALPRNSVGTKQIKKNAVTSVKVKDNSLTGADILESSLGKVPSAASADNSTHATSADSATHATSADSATNATHATSADTLGGVSKSVWGTAMMYQGTAFHPRNPSTTWTDYYSTSFWSGGIQCTAGSDPLFLMPLSLPQGATVTRVTMYYDNVAAGNCGAIFLSRFALATHTGADIASASSGSTLGYGTVSITPNAVIDNTTNAYAVYWYPTLNTNIFGGALVEYTLPGAVGGPAVHAAADQSSGLSTIK